MEKTALILQHTSIERGGLYETVLEEEDWALDVRPLYSGSSLPASLADYGMILVLGGPMSANDEAEFPFLKEETFFIRKAIKIGYPVLGVCLGAQLMAKALGAGIYPGPHKEIGWYWLNQTPAARIDPLFGMLDPYFLVFQWHGETFDLPTEAVCLAGNQAYPHQAFRYGNLAYGLQFHMEITKPMLKNWISSWAEEITEARPKVTGQGIMSEAKIYLDRVNRQARAIFQEFTRGAEISLYQNCNKNNKINYKNVEQKTLNRP
ncbi:MAG TPA: type 1 glutamine amidotransferase [Thermodesulfobacteriota bacterium]|nr:type 1 glutamine amidotransferase [Thermodesulfobacteriota bacterium]